MVAPKKVAEATWNAEAAQRDHLEAPAYHPGAGQRRIQALNALETFGSSIVRMCPGWWTTTVTAGPFGHGGAG